MRTPAIVPTVTQRVRSFLAQQGAAIRPWAGLQETYDELYALLLRRKTNPEFWRPLKELLQEVVHSAADSQRRDRRAAGAVELLDSWQIDTLVDELRDALPADASACRSTRADFTRSLSTAVLGGFLLLGLAAAGCSGGGGAPGGTGGAGGRTVLVGGAGGGSGGAVADSGGADGPACTQTVDSALEHAIGESTLGTDAKSQLCQCFSALGTSWTTSLTQLFASATPDEISNMLGGLLRCCQSDGIETLAGFNAGPSSQDLDLIRSGAGYRICTAVIYKGVSFAD